MQPHDNLCVADPRTPFAVLVCFFVGANFFLFPLLSSRSAHGDLFAMLALAVLSAEVCLVAAWGVFGTAPFLRRLSRCAAMGLGAYLSLAFGIILAFSNQNLVAWDELATFVATMLMFLACLPSVFFCVQLPLWALRVWFGWETLNDSEPAGSYARPVLIKDMVLATAAVGVALSLIRMAPSLIPEIAAQRGEFLAFIAFAAAVATGSSLIALPPLVYAILGKHAAATSAVAAAAWAAVLMGILLATLTLSSGSLPPMRVVAIIFAMTLLFVGLFTGGLVLVRNRGYRLRCRSDRVHSALDS